MGGWQRGQRFGYLFPKCLVCYSPDVFWVSGEQVQHPDSLVIKPLLTLVKLAIRRQNLLPGGRRPKKQFEGWVAGWVLCRFWREETEVQMIVSATFIIRCRVFMLEAAPEPHSDTAGQNDLHSAMVKNT